MIEEAASAGPFVDDFGQGEDKTPGNLLPAVAQSFEDGTVGGWSLAAGAATLASSTAQAFAGVRSLGVTLTATAITAVASAIGTAGVPVVAGRTYTASHASRSPVARNVRAVMKWYTASGAAASTANVNGPDVAAPANAWVRSVVTATAPADAAYAAVQWQTVDAGTSGEVYFIDAVRLSEGTSDAAYRWTGAEHASTSVRAAGRVKHDGPFPAFPSVATVVARVPRTPDRRHRPDGVARHRRHPRSEGRRLHDAD